MSKNELIDFLKLGCLAGEAAAIAERTPEKEWVKKLKTISTYLDKIMLERLNALDREELKSVERRQKYTKIVLSSEDKNRYGEVIEKEIVRCDMEDLETLAELALNSCAGFCQGGERVKNCKFRKAMHRLGLAVANDNPKNGECEYVVR